MAGYLSDWWNTPSTDKQSDAYKGLLRGGLAMMAASGPSRMPVGFGQALAAGGTGMLDSMDASKLGRQKDYMFEQQKAKDKTAREMAEADAKRKAALRQWYKTNDPKSPAGMMSSGALEKMAIEKSKRGAGPYSGKAMDAQNLNVLLTGDLSTPHYAAAYEHYSRPKNSIDAQTGQMTSVTPDMSSIRPPTFRQPVTGAGPKVARKPVAPPKLSDAQSKAKGFHDRMLSAEKILEAVEGEGASFWGRLVENFPGGNYAQSSEYQQFEQARRNFVNAVLRRESGAVINPSEFENADKQYFPVPGDSSQVIAQKRQNRTDAVEGMLRSATPGYVEKKSKPTSRAGRKYEAMSATDFLSVDISKLSKAQQNAYGKEMTRRGM